MRKNTDKTTQNQIYANNVFSSWTLYYRSHTSFIVSVHSNYGRSVVCTACVCVFVVRTQIGSKGQIKAKSTDTSKRNGNNKRSKKKVCAFIKLWICWCIYFITADDDGDDDDDNLNSLELGSNDTANCEVNKYVFRSVRIQLAAVNNVVRASNDGKCNNNNKQIELENKTVKNLIKFQRDAFNYLDSEWHPLIRLVRCVLLRRLIMKLRCFAESGNGFLELWLPAIRTVSISSSFLLFFGRGLNTCTRTQLILSGV